MHKGGITLSRKKTFTVNRQEVDEIMKANNLSQVKLAELVNESRQTIGKYKWTEETLLKVCEVINHSPEDILVLTPEDKKEYQYLFDAHKKYIRDIRREQLQEQGIDTSLLSFIRSLDFKISFYGYNDERITVYTQSIAYIQLEKEEQVKRYSIKQFQKIRKDILELLISQK